MNEADFAAMIIISTMLLCAFAVAAWLYFSMPDNEGCARPYKAGDFVELFNGDHGTVAHVGKHSVLVYLIGVEAGQYYNHFGDHDSGNGSLRIVRVVNHIDMVI